MTMLNIKNMLKWLTNDPTFVIVAMSPTNGNRIKLTTKSYDKRDELVTSFKAVGCIVTVTKI
jgi:hypothetical protein